jgi:hypothetical protein
VRQLNVPSYCHLEPLCPRSCPCPEQDRPCEGRARKGAPRTGRKSKRCNEEVLCVVCVVCVCVCVGGVSYFRFSLQMFVALIVALISFVTPLPFPQIKAFVAGTVADSAPIIPISAQLKYNVDLVCRHIVTNVGVNLKCFQIRCLPIVLLTAGLFLCLMSGPNSAARLHVDSTPHRHPLVRCEQARRRGALA